MLNLIESAFSFVRAEFRKRPMLELIQDEARYITEKKFSARKQEEIPRTVSKSSMTVDIVFGQAYSSLGTNRSAKC